MRFSLAHKPVILLTLLSLLASVLSAPVAARAQNPPPPSPDVLQISAQTQGAVITYDAEASRLAASDAAQKLPTRRYRGYQLPMQLFTLAVAADSEPAIEVRGLMAGELAVPPQPLAPETPPALGWVPDPNYAPLASALPTEPVFIARQGSIGGQRFVVVAVSPIYAAGGASQIATRFEAVIAGAAPVAGATLQATSAQPASSTGVAVSVPVNAAALVDGYKLTVTKPGLQEVLYSELGLASEPANLRLTSAGVDVAVEKAGDRLRFYAPQAGDRWNAATAYWLTLEQGSIMAPRAAAPAGPKVGAFEQGEWRDNRLYETGYSGMDGDHWFHVDLSAPALLPAGGDITQNTAVTVPVQTILPVRSGTSTYQVISSAYLMPPAQSYCNTPYQLHVQGLAGGNLAETQVIDWQAAANCKIEKTSTAIIPSTGPLTSLLLRLNPNGYYNTGIKLEAVTWRRPVALDFQSAGAGSEFFTDAGAGSLALRNLPAAWGLYDVTQLVNPKVVASGAGGDYTLNQSASAPASRYLLANLSALQRPAVQQHAATKLGNVKSADALYIGPEAFADELAPLLALRQQQGFKPLFVDVQAIYDVFGYGQISAVALRNFLRQESDWQNSARQISVVLAGDATIDPFAFGGIANETVVAAWIGEVDPYLGALGNNGEAACDACIAQLDGDDPVTGDNQGGGLDWFAADVWIGRLPARTGPELADMVAKLVAYDTSSDASSIDGSWRMRKVFLADNFFMKLDAQRNVRPDEAGDFAVLSDNILAMLPNPSSARRIYYDPVPDRQLALSPQGEPVPVPGGFYQTVPRLTPENWRISDITGINTEVIATLSQGAGLVAYNGHSNHFYYARTEDVNNTGTGDKWLLNAPEVSLLGNARKEFVMLSMTCYTAQFVKPAANGTLDEWLIRHKNGGAIAVWGPTGLSVVSGHEMLQQGFVRQLADGSAGEQRLGNLVEAGYTNLLTQNGPLDPLMTFVLLGDPLTMARIPTRDLYLPSIQR